MLAVILTYRIRLIAFRLRSRSGNWHTCADLTSRDAIHPCSRVFFVLILLAKRALGRNRWLRIINFTICLSFEFSSSCLAKLTYEISTFLYRIKYRILFGCNICMKQNSNCDDLEMMPVRNSQWTSLVLGLSNHGTFRFSLWRVLSALFILWSHSNPKWFVLIFPEKQTAK